eukprot:scaffold33567_cov79-Isochrysis_galbana.AAC.2
MPMRRGRRGRRDCHRGRRKSAMPGRPGSARGRPAELHLPPRPQTGAGCGTESGLDWPRRNCRASLGHPQRATAHPQCPRFLPTHNPAPRTPRRAGATTIAWPQWVGRRPPPWPRRQCLLSLVSPRRQQPPPALHSRRRRPARGTGWRAADLFRARGPNRVPFRPGSLPPPGRSRRRRA